MHFRVLLPLTEFCQVQNSLCIQVLCSPILAALLYGTQAAGVRQNFRHATRNGITELSQRAPPVFGRVAITFGIGAHSGLCCFLPVYKVQTLSSSPSNSIPNIALYMYVYIIACLCNISDKMKPKTLQVLGSLCTENRPGKYCAG